MWTKCWQYQRKIWNPGSITDANRAFFMKDNGTKCWKWGQISVSYRYCHRRQKRMRWWSAGNVKDGDRALAVSNGCYGTLALLEKRPELWLHKKWGWHSDYTSVCLWHLAMLNIARNGHLAFSNLGIQTQLC